MKDERGVALLVALIVTVLLTLLGISMAFDSMTDVTISKDLENYKKALAAAETGFSTYKEALRGRDITAILDNTDPGVATTCPQYISYTVPSGTAGVYFNRNPIAPIEAMNIDFNNLPTSIGNRTASSSHAMMGVMTPADGVDVPYEPHTTGPHSNCHGAGNHSQCARYWVKITNDNDGDEIDEDLTTDTDGDSDPTNDLYVDDEDGIGADPVDSQYDTNGTIYMRVLGAQPLGAGQTSTYNGTVKNSIVIIEAKLERDMSLKLNAAFSLYGGDATPTSGTNLFAGAVPTIDAFDHGTYGLTDLTSKGWGKSHTETASPNIAAIDVINENPPNDADTIKATLYAAMLGPPDTRSNFIGAKSDYPNPNDTPGAGEPSLRDATNIILNDPAPDAANVLDADYMVDFVNQMAAVADNVVADGATLGSVSLGTDGSPEITYCVGDCTLNASTGTGLLIVRGKLQVTGGFAYRGLVLVVGDGEFQAGGLGGASGIMGGLFVAGVNLVSGSWVYDDPKFTLDGTLNLYYQLSGIQLAFYSLPFKTVSWREINPEIEP